MTNQHRFLHGVNAGMFFRRALQGAALAVVLLIAFLTAAGAIDKGTWVFTPAATVAVGGACGGGFYYVMNHLRRHTGCNRALVNVFCLAVYAVGLWLSLIFGLSLVGLWN